MYSAVGVNILALASMQYLIRSSTGADSFSFMGFQKLNEYQGFGIAAQGSSLVNLSLHLITFGAFMTCLALLLGSLPVLSSIVQSALTRKRFGPLFLPGVPVLAFAVFLGTTYLLEALFGPGNHLALPWHLFLERGLFLGILLTGILVSVVAMCQAVLHSEIPASHFRFTLLPSMLAVISMLFTLAATISWGLSLQASAPQFFTTNEGVFASSTPASWLGIVVIMTIAVVVATLALLRGRSARLAMGTSTE
jgi:hypothetical protein